MKVASELPVVEKKDLPSRAASPASASTEQNWSWQPMADSPSTKQTIRPQATAPTRQAVAHHRSTVGASRRPEWSVIAAGAVTGVVAGYLLVFLIR
jgi:histidyl-tRNA synthetase